MKKLSPFKIFFTSLGVLLSAMLILSVSSCKKDNISDGAGDFDPNGDIVIMAVSLADQGAQNDVKFMDISGGLVYNLEQASTRPETIDILMQYEAGTGFSLITPPDIHRLAQSEVGRVMNNTWLNKNKATVFKMSASAEINEVFRNAKTSGDVKNAYQRYLNEMSGSDVDVFGPGKSLTGVEKGDLVFFHSEDRNFYALMKVFKTETETGTIEFEIKMDNNSVIAVQPADPSNLMTMYDASFEGPGQTKGRRYMDFSNGESFDNIEVIANQHRIDFVAFNASASGINFIVPAAESLLGGFGGGKTMNSDWLVKNDGEFLRLPASEMADSLFLFTLNNEMIRNAYTTVAQDIENTPDYDVTAHGPRGGVRPIEEGDVVLFKSESRKIYGILKVTELVSGNSGRVAFSAKVDNSQKVDIAPAPNRQFEMESAGYNSAHFLDFLEGVDYTEEDGKPVSEKIDLIFTRGSSTYINLFPTNNEAALKAWSASVWPARMAEWETRNDVLLVNIGDDPIYETLREGKLEDMKQAYEDAGTPSPRLTRIAKNDVIFFHSIDRGFYGAIKVIDAVNDGYFHFKYKVAKE